MATVAASLTRISKNQPRILSSIVFLNNSWIIHEYSCLKQELFSGGHSRNAERDGSRNTESSIISPKVQKEKRMTLLFCHPLLPTLM